MAQPEQRTHVEITKERRRELRVWKAKRDLTYDEAIEELLSGYAGDSDSDGECAE